MTDAFRVAMKTDPRATELFAALGESCDRPAGPDEIRGALRELSWALLDGTLDAAPVDALNRAAGMTRNHSASLTPDHRLILEAIESSVRHR
jgi:hypothetical protein